MNELPKRWNNHVYPAGYDRDVSGLTVGEAFTMAAMQALLAGGWTQRIYPDGQTVGYGDMAFMTVQARKIASQQLYELERFEAEATKP